MENIFKQKTAAWTIVILLIINLATLTTIWYREFRKPDFRPFAPRDRQERKENVPRFMKEELNLDENQFQAFEKIRTEYLERAGNLMSQMHDLREELFREVLAATPDSLKTVGILQKIGDKQVEFDRNIYSYFMEIRALCGEQNEDKLHALMQDLFFHGQPGGKDGPPPMMGKQPGGAPPEGRFNDRHENRPEPPPGGPHLGEKPVERR